MIIYNYCVRFKEEGKKDSYHTYNLLTTLANKDSDFDVKYHFRLWFSQLSILCDYYRGNVCRVRYHQNYRLSGKQQEILYTFCQRLFNHYFRYTLRDEDLAMIMVDIWYFLKHNGQYGFFAQRPDKRWMRFRIDE